MTTTGATSLLRKAQGADPWLAYGPLGLERHHQPDKGGHGPKVLPNTAASSAPAASWSLDLRVHQADQTGSKPWENIEQVSPCWGRGRRRCVTLGEEDRDSLQPTPQPGIPHAALPVPGDNPPQRAGRGAEPGGSPRTGVAGAPGTLLPLYYVCVPGTHSFRFFSWDGETELSFPGSNLPPGVGTPLDPVTEENAWAGVPQSPSLPELPCSLFRGST